MNHSPSFGVDTPLDLAIKGDLISDAIELVRIDPKLVRRVEAERKLASQSRLMAHKKRGAESVTRGDRDRVRSVSHWSPYDRVRVVNADP